MELADEQGRTPLIWAAYLELDSVIDILTQAGANLWQARQLAIMFELDEKAINLLGGSQSTSDKSFLH